MMFCCNSNCYRYKTCLWPKKVRLQNTGNYEIYDPQALSSTLASLGRHSQRLWVINSVDPCVLKSKYYLNTVSTLISIIAFY